MIPLASGLKKPSVFAQSILDRPTSFVHALDLSVDPYLPEILGAFPLQSESLEPDPDLLTPVSVRISRTETDGSKFLLGRNLLLECMHNQICSTDECWDDESLTSEQSLAKEPVSHNDSELTTRGNIGELLSPVTPKQVLQTYKTISRAQSDNVITRHSTAVSKDVDMDSLFKKRSLSIQPLGIDKEKAWSPDKNRFSVAARRSWRKSKIFQANRRKSGRVIYDGAADSGSLGTEKNNFSSFGKKESMRFSNIFGLSRKPHDEQGSVKNRQSKPNKYRFSSLFERIANRSPRLLSGICKMFVRELTIPANVAKIRFRSVLEKSYNSTLEERDNTINAKLVLNLGHKGILVNVALVIESRGLISCVYMRQLQTERSQTQMELFERFCDELCSEVLGIR